MRFVIIGSGTVAVLWFAAHFPADVLLRPWYLSRGSGLVAMALLWLSVVLGLLQSAGLLRGLTKPADSVGLHDYLSMAALYATLFHALILVFDHYTGLTVSEVLVPFGARFRPGELALGSIAFYLSLAAAVTTYLRHRMSPAAWRAVHLFSLVGFTAALVHGLLAGSDTALRPVFYLYLTAGTSVALLTAYRGWTALR